MSAKVSIIEEAAAINFSLDAFQSDAFQFDAFQYGHLTLGSPVAAQVAIIEITPE